MVPLDTINLRYYDEIVLWGMDEEAGGRGGWHAPDCNAEGV